MTILRTIDFFSVGVILILAIIIVIISQNKVQTQQEQLTQIYDNGVNDALDCVVLKVLALETQSISITWGRVQDECRETLHVSSGTSDHLGQKIQGFFSN